MPWRPRLARTKPTRRALAWGAAGLAVALIAGCGGSDKLDRPNPVPSNDQLYRIQPPPARTGPPSSFSKVIDEAIRRKKVIEQLERIEGSAEP